MLGRILGTVETVAQSAASVANERLRSITALAETVLWLLVGILVLLTLAILFVVSPTAGVGLAIVLFGGYWLYSRE